MLKKTKYIPVIGLEVHVQLLTSKIFSTETAVYGAPPNTQTSAISLAHPGTLPILNPKPIAYAIKFGLACHAEITRKNWFDRKNYTYPDLPKGFQITQHRTPICRHGFVMIDTASGHEKQVALERIHLEEDTGKLMHGETTTIIDFNRAGSALIEIVTKPVLASPEEAGSFLREVRRLVRYLGISNGNMEEGSLRCDANISIMQAGDKKLGNKVELKNMNSIRHVRLAAAEEIARQTVMLEQGKVVAEETRSYDLQTGRTKFLRTKEGLADYRYFVELDLSPFDIDAQYIEEIRKTIPILPRILAKKFTNLYGLSPSASHILTDDKETSLFFEAVCQHTKHYKIATNWVLGPIKSYLNTKKIQWDGFPLTPYTVAKLADMVAEKLISFAIAAQTLFPQLIKAPKANPYVLVKEQGLQVDNVTQLKKWVEEVLGTYTQEVALYHEGKKSLFGFFMGEVMKLSNRKANPAKVAQLLRKYLSE